MHLRLSRPFQRFLTLALSDKREPLLLEDRLRATITVGDYADVAPPHQNPYFGSGATVTARVGESGKIVLSNGIRPFRVKVVTQLQGTLPRIGVTSTDPIDANEVTTIMQSLGPSGDDVATTIFRNGTGPLELTGSAFLLTTEYLNMPGIGLLVQPSHFFVVENSTLNEVLQAFLMIEEIPRFGEVVNAGYPGIGD
ncbi:MAG: hypothetical protein V3V67_18470 [Myxococcota bacterium]